MTERNDPRAVFQPVYGCNPDTDAVQIELAFQLRETSPPGGLICVRSAAGERHEFRYAGAGNTSKSLTILTCSLLISLRKRPNQSVHGSEDGTCKPGWQ